MNTGYGSGTHRLADWSPLAESDPVPGDPSVIRDEAHHMKQVAQSLREQAAELRVIGHGEGLKGKYADQLRDSSAELEKHLREVAERYEHVHGRLSSWAGELEDFQSESVQLLLGAQDAHEHAKPAARHTAAHETAHPSLQSQHATPAPHSHDDPVQPYRVSLQRLTEHRDQRATHYAQQINGACDDIIKDSWWERFSDDVGDVFSNRWISDIFNALGIIVSVIGIIALFCTPAGWIITACTVIGIALAAKDVLAAATGNGSWFDVGLDVVGFLGGFALGKALKSLKAIRAATKVAAEGAAAERAGAQVMRDSEGGMRDTYRVTGSRTSSRAARAAARQARGAVRGRASAAGERARAAEHDRAAPQPSRSETAAAGGDKDAATAFKDVCDMRSRYPHNPSVQQASRHAGSVMGTARTIAGTNTVLDWGSKAAGTWSDEYASLENKYTMAIGSQW